jgi:Phage integrase family
MHQMKRRRAYQYGTLALETRKRGPAYGFIAISISRTDEGDGRRPSSGHSINIQPGLRRSVRANICASLPTPKASCQNVQPFMRSPTAISRRCFAPVSMFRLVANRASRLESRSTVRSRTSRSSTSGSGPAGRATRCAISQVQPCELPSKNGSVRYGARSDTPPGLRQKTVRSIFNVMKLTFKFAVKWGYIAENPLGEKRVELPRGSTKRSKQPVQLTVTDSFSLLARLGLRERLAVAFEGWLGPRISEAFGLQWQDMNFDHGIVSFQRGLVEGRITPLKTEAWRANLPMPEEVLELLLEWRSVTPYHQPNDWVFASPYTRASVRSGRRNCSRPTSSRWRFEQASRRSAGTAFGIR